MYQFDMSISQFKDVLSFIYDGVVEVNDIVAFLNHGETLEVYGLNAKNRDQIWAVKSDEGNPLRHEIKVVAANIPLDFPLLKTDVRISKEEVGRLSLVSKSGSEYDPDLDSDCEVRPKIVSKQRQRRNAKVNGAAQKSVKPVLAAQKKKNNARKRSSESKMMALPNFSKQTDSQQTPEVDGNSEEEKVTLSKKVYEQMLRALGQLGQQSESDTDERGAVGYIGANDQDAGISGHCDNNDGEYNGISYYDGDYELTDDAGNDYVNDTYQESSDVAMETVNEFEEAVDTGLGWQYDDNVCDENMNVVMVEPEQKTAEKTDTKRSGGRTIPKSIRFEIIFP